MIITLLKFFVNTLDKKTLKSPSDSSFALPLSSTAENVNKTGEPAPVIEPSFVTSGLYAKRVADLSKKVKFEKNFVENFIYYEIDSLIGNGVFKDLPVAVRNDFILQTWEGLNSLQTEGAT